MANAAIALQSINGRSIKFTPERMQQIRNLIERGMTREEIAATIGSTVGSLQVTCSRLGISLRPPKIPKPDRKPTARNGFPALPAPELPARISTAPYIQLSFVSKYRGEIRETALPFDHEMIFKLLAEAHLRDISLGELMVAIITARL